MQELDEVAVAELLGRAGAAHGVYEEGELGGVYDQQWPQWYAAYLMEHGLCDLVGAVLTVDEVAAWLSVCDAAYKVERPAVSWPTFYARRAERLKWYEIEGRRPRHEELP
jgi:hypothetical protein